MKGLEPLIAVIFIIVISIVGILIIVETTQPSVGRLQEINLMEEGKNILTQIDNAVRDVAQQGEGSTRVLSISVTDGTYIIDTENEAITFSMRSIAQIIGVGISRIEENINMFGEPNKVILNLTYTNVNVTGGGNFGKGYHKIIIRNNGYDFVNQKQIISISSIAPVLPPTALTVQFNQDGSPHIVSGTNIGGVPNNLNFLNDDATYDIEEEGSGVGSQYSRPISDISTGSWDDPNGNNNNILYDDIDGISADDNDYIQSSNDPSSDTCEIELSDITDPGVDTGHVIRYRYGTGMSGTGKPSEIDLVVRLMEGSTEIASWAYSNLAGNSPFVTSTQTLTEAQASAISDYTNLRIIFTATKVGKGVRTIWMEISWVEFEIQGDINYQVEVWHNSTPISYSGSLFSVNVTVNFTTTVTDDYSLQIYDWANLQWVSIGCDSGTILANTPTKWWCNENINPMNYNSSDNIVRIRINSASDSDQSLLKEDYVQYYVNYLP